MRSESGVWNPERGVWILEISIHHTPDFQQWIMKNPYTTLQIWNVSLCNLDTTLITLEIWKYLSGVAVLFKPYTTWAFLKPYTTWAFLKPYTTWAFFKPYTTRAAPSWCMVSKMPSWCMVSKNTATPKRYFHTSLLKCVVSTRNNKYLF